MILNLGKHQPIHLTIAWCHIYFVWQHQEGKLSHPEQLQVVHVQGLQVQAVEF